MRTSSIIYLVLLLAFQIFDLILAIVFSLLDFRGREKIRNPEFHKTLAIYFVILMVVSLLFWII